MKNSKTPNRTKILFIHHGKGIGGASLSLLYLVLGLDKQKFHPIVLFMANSAAVELFRKNNIQIIGPINRSDFSHTKIWWYRWYHGHHLLRALIDSAKLLLGQADSLLKKIRPDIVHLNTSSLFAWAICARKNNIPVVWHIREPLSSGYFGIRKKLTTLAVKKLADTIVPICKNDALPWADDRKTSVIYNAVPTDRFKADNKEKNSNLTLLFLGGLSQEKGTLLLLLAFKKVLEFQPEAKLLIAGLWAPKLGLFESNFAITAWQKYCKKTLSELELIKNSIEILGVCQNVDQLINSSTLLVSPFTVGHFSRPVIEAGFLSKPVVAPNLPPFDELIEDGKTGLLFKASDAHDLAAKILVILQNRAFASELGKNAQIFCRKKFGIEEQIRKISQIYKSLLQ